jgi:23S rRNA pseudouridine2457 synthase
VGRVLLLNKPYGVVCQFSPHPTRPTLATWVDVPQVYPAGRLDWDSEGLVILTDDGPFQHCISHPTRKFAKRYWVQVEGIPSDLALGRLAQGVDLADGPTRPAKVSRLTEPSLWLRQPPIRARAAIPTCWLDLVLVEGRNRQVRRMTAAIGHPTLRLVRVEIGPWSVFGLAPGQWTESSSTA